MPTLSVGKAREDTREERSWPISRGARCSADPWLWPRRKRSRFHASPTLVRNIRPSDRFPPRAIKAAPEQPASATRVRDSQRRTRVRVFVVAEAPMDEHEIRKLLEQVKAGRVSRRSFVQTMVGLGLTAPMAAQLLPVSRVAQGQPKSAGFMPTKRGGGGRLRLLWWQAPTLLNPHLSVGLTNSDGLRIFYEPLASFDPDGNPVPVLADVTPETWSKRLQLLAEVAPGATRIALLWNRRALSGSEFILDQMNDAATKMKMTVRSVEVRGPDDLAAAFASMTPERIGGIVFVTSADLFGHLRQIAELAVEHRIPMVSLYREVTVVGSLLSYGPDLSHIFRRSATYVDRILRGAKPGDLAIEQPTKFELVINVKTAKALGLTIPPSLLLRADQVIACPEKAGASSGC